MHGLQNGNRDRSVRLTPGPRPRAPFEHARQDRDDLIRRRDHGNRDRDHWASKPTPKATRQTPHHRRESTRSFRTIRARIVSTTMFSAEAGTAKLRSAVWTRMI